MANISEDCSGLAGYVCKNYWDPHLNKQARRGDVHLAPSYAGGVGKAALGKNSYPEKKLKQKRTGA
jgi:hypothetical protein